jgi:hypothetical protein
VRLGRLVKLALAFWILRWAAMEIAGHSARFRNPDGD